MKGIILLSIGLCVSAVAQGQLTSIEFYANVNQAIIGDRTKESANIVGEPTTVGYSVAYPNYSVTEQYDSKLGFEFGAHVRYKIGKKWSIISGLQINRLGFERRTVVENFDQYDGVITGSVDLGEYGGPIGTPYGEVIGVPIGENGEPIIIDGSELLISNPDYPYTIAYMNLPLMAEYQFTDKLSIRTGIKVMQRIYSKTTRREFAFVREPLQSGSDITVGDNVEVTLGSIPIDYEINEVEDTSGKGLNETLLSASVGLSYAFISNISFNLRYDKSFTPIFESSEQYGGKAKYNIVNVGLSYRLSLMK